MKTPFTPITIVFIVAITLILGSQEVADVDAPGYVAVDERPVVNVPLKLRQENWLGSRGEGSCVHATFISLMRWQGREQTAEHWRRTHGDGEYPDSFYAQLDTGKIRYAETTSGDVKFLEWACRTRRGAGITVMGGAHMIALVHLDDKWAAVLDNNDTSKFKWIPRETLIAEWKASYGWAVSPVYTPAAPLPR